MTSFKIQGRGGEKNENWGGGGGGGGTNSS